MICRFLIAVLIAASAAPSARADFDAPAKPKIDCTNSANKDKPACKPRRGEAAIDELYNAAYWMARREEYQAALDLIGPGALADSRLLTIRGYALRKLGRTEEAVTQYLKALAIDPEKVRTREYLGETYVTQQRFDLARGQLQEIETLCGRACSEYVKLTALLGEHGGVDR